MKRRQLKITLFLLLVLFASLFIYLQPGVLGMPATSFNTLIALFPGIVVVIISIFYIGRSHGFSRVASWVGLGMSLAFFFSLVNAQGLFVGLLAGLALADVQIWSVVGCIFAGAVMYGIDK